MDPSTTGLSITALIIVLLVAYAGTEETMRLFAFVDLHIRYSWVKFRMMLMRRKLKQQLIKDLPEYNKLIKELNKDG
jgi:hypothetical protein